MLKFTSYGTRVFVLGICIGFGLATKSLNAFRTDRPQNPETFNPLSSDPSAEEVAAHARQKVEYKAYMTQIRNIQCRYPNLSREQVEYQLYREDLQRLEMLQKQVAESMEKVKNN